MADKSAREAALELIEAVKDEIGRSKTGAQPIAKNEYTPQEVVQAIGVTIRQQINEYENELVKMRTREADTLRKAELKKSLFGIPSSTPSESQIKDGDANKQVPKKNVFSLLKPATMKGEDFIDLEHASDPKKRIKNIGSDGVLPKPGGKSKEIPAEGSGGDVKLGKEAMGSEDSPAKPAEAPKAPALKPAGVPGMKVGQAPKVPAPPKAPGMTGSTMKSESVAKGDLDNTKQLDPNKTKVLPGAPPKMSLEQEYQAGLDAKMNPETKAKIDAGFKQGKYGLIHMNVTSEDPQRQAFGHAQLKELSPAEHVEFQQHAAVLNGAPAGSPPKMNAPVAAATGAPPKMGASATPAPLPIKAAQSSTPPPLPARSASTTTPPPLPGKAPAVSTLAMKAELPTVATPTFDAKPAATRNIAEVKSRMANVMGKPKSPVFKVKAPKT